MRLALTLVSAVFLGPLLTGCSSKLDRNDVLEFVDAADAAARKRYAPEICELRGEKFTLHLRFQSDEARMPPTELDLDRRMFCREAAKFSRLRQYKLERKSLDIELAADRRTARVVAEYVETMPYYPPDTMVATPDMFSEWQVVESRDESVVGIESGDLVFLSANVDAQQKLHPKADFSLPYD